MAKKKTKKKIKSELVILEHKETGFRYYTFRNKKVDMSGSKKLNNINSNGKLELQKYHPILRKKVTFVEVKG